MNGDIQTARKLLLELREAYQGLPRDMQARVARLLRASAPAETIRPPGREPARRAPSQP